MIYNNGYDPNQPRAKDGKWTDGPKTALEKAKEAAEEEDRRNKKVRYDRAGNPIGDGSFNVEPEVMEFAQYPQVVSDVELSDTTESSYVTYINTENGKSITVRFSDHENNAVKFGDQLDGRWATGNEILYHLGLKKRTFIPDTKLEVGWYAVKRSEMNNYEEIDKTLSELYALPVGTDLEIYKGKRAKGSNRILLGGKVEHQPITRRNSIGQSVQQGRYEYEDIK